MKRFERLIWLVFFGAAADVWSTMFLFWKTGEFVEQNRLVTPDNFVAMAILRMLMPTLIVWSDITLRAIKTNHRGKAIAFSIFMGLFFTWIPALSNLDILPNSWGTAICIFCR
ncbi:MAG: hypothetical protein GTO24_21240 [candidate division Zixibacteria bacterium]|nr:hypothetical protein [candidate division Zixibacteria bacterium]